MNMNHLFRVPPGFPIIALALLISAGTSLRAAELTWQTDFTQASQQAAQEHKYILLDFTGSDWCPWCIKMDKEVFNQSQFSDFALKNLVLVKVDFPRKAAQSPAEKSQNQDLAKKYAIEGLPTYVLLDSSGKEVRRQVGYLQGGATSFIDWLGLSGQTQG
ncbi:MAG: thioredoxin fold domain-containing protein [Verrucomicrobia bacterium]|nr:thioredoxin fold domain-containing protein [Verrucomicrobiota bacterium]